ncbi:hypothetical protein Rumeso_02948 [Rubellimicrobium mesophilum DSM 19309]|uniref:Uncharacterized protein n=1 Tax=Rubellimicrobium mesophilum DSM 19309 TaxID=442562 RepID=A0A017HMC4_9RHOB|nr:hypothetical protein [Rubellimicrobium mesophilum]EYD75465.1 hypothetical protein Rumeso_02948 [Rubellimicrobium mesophilum DSM 19309]
MTALSQYARLETTGLWRTGPGDAGREVVVSFGKATLVLSDSAGLPLTHWSLPAITRLNPGAAPALYAPDIDGSETLEVEDDTMVSAIETVRAAVAKGQAAAPRQIRWVAGWLVVAAALAGAVLWLPGALQREALAVVPDAKRTEIGATILGHLQRTLGGACRDPLGAEALARLHDRALGNGGQAVVLPLGPASPIELPGGITILSREMVERAAEPAVVAGQLLAARVAAGDDPLARLLDDVGLWATLKLLATGDLDPDALARHAEDLLAAPAPALGADRLGPAFSQAQVPLKPYALDRDPTGAGVADLLAADAHAAQEPPILLTDSEWVALQGICEGG